VEKLRNINHLGAEKEDDKKEVDLHHQQNQRADCSVYCIVIGYVHKKVYEERDYKKADCAEGRIKDAAFEQGFCSGNKAIGYGCTYKKNKVEDKSS
jgi:hypothetical protein